MTDTHTLVMVGGRASHQAQRVDDARFGVVCGLPEAAAWESSGRRMLVFVVADVSSGAGAHSWVQRCGVRRPARGVDLAEGAAVALAGVRAEGGGNEPPAGFLSLPAGKNLTVATPNGASRVCDS